MDKIQLVFFFISGFLISRLIIKVGLPEWLANLLLGGKHHSLTRITLYLVALSATLSLFVPNAITVLTLLPLLELLRRYYESCYTRHEAIATILTLAAIYGANIGGMGSITATPANAVLIGFIELNSIDGASRISFASWLLWGIPLVVLLCLLAWSVLASVFRTWRYVEKSADRFLHFIDWERPHQITALVLSGCYFFSSLLLSALIMEFPEYNLVLVSLAGAITLALTLFLFVPGRRNKPLLRLQDCYSNLPLRGFVFVGIAIVIAGVLYLLDVHTYFAGALSAAIPAGLPLLGLLLLFALVTSFATEILSNTAAQISMFVILVPLAEHLSFPPLSALIVVTLSCTSAFMSPIATGVNGLAFGGVHGVSLIRMLGAGLVMNLAAAVVVALWVWLVVSGLYGLN